MAKVYGIFKSIAGEHRRPALVELFTEKKFAIKQLVIWSDEIRHGKWPGAELVRFHEEDAEEVTWMLVKPWNGPEENYSVEEFELRDSAPTASDSAY